MTKDIIVNDTHRTTAADGGSDPDGIIRIGSATKGRKLAPTEFASVNVFGAAAAASRGRFNDTREAKIHGVVDLLRAGDNTDNWSDPDFWMSSFGEAILRNTHLGVDMLAVPPGGGFPPHVHPGHHLLLCLKGPGTFSLNGVVHSVVPGDIYMVEGGIPHAVGNPHDDQPHVLLAFGAPPKELDAHDRMTLVDWNGQLVQAPE
jgi:quercetin dioxygenase-like cupin family protein